MTWIRRMALFFLVALLTLYGAAVGAQSAPTLRFSLPPVLEALPFAFAQEWGLFEEHGLSVELIAIADNQQRSAALMTGNLDALMEDVTRSILDMASGNDIVITSASTSRPQTGGLTMALLSPAAFRVDSFDALMASNHAIGTLYRSDYEYLLDELLEVRLEDGAEPPRTMYFHDMLQMAVWFGAQTLPAAVLPEPYVSYLSTYHPPGSQPIKLVIHDDFSNIGALPAVIVFQRAYTESQPETVAAFYAAYREAIERMNATPRDELIDLGIDAAISLFFQGADRSVINQEVIDTIPIPVFELPTALSQERYEDILAWMLQKGYAFKSPSYEEITDFQFVP